MKIIYKDKWNFWPFRKYYFYLETEEEGLVEMSVDKKTWEKYNVGDFCDSHYLQFYHAHQAYAKQTTNN